MNPFRKINHQITRLGEAAYDDSPGRFSTSAPALDDNWIVGKIVSKIDPPRSGVDPLINEYEFIPQMPRLDGQYFDHPWIGELNRVCREMNNLVVPSAMLTHGFFAILRRRTISNLEPIWEFDYQFSVREVPRDAQECDILVAITTSNSSSPAEYEFATPAVNVAYSHREQFTTPASGYWVYDPFPLAQDLAARQVGDVVQFSLNVSVLATTTGSLILEWWNDFITGFNVAEYNTIMIRNAPVNNLVHGSFSIAMRIKANFLGLPGLFLPFVRISSLDLRGDITVFTSVHEVFRRNVPPCEDGDSFGSDFLTLENQQLVPT